MLSKTTGRPWGRWALCATLFGVGAWCLGNTMAMSFASGAHNADSYLGKIVQPSTSLAIDVALAVLSAAVFALLASGKWQTIISGVMLSVVLVGFGFMSAKNTLAFGMIERQEKAERLKANSNAETTAIARTNQTNLGIQERNLSWLRARYEHAKKQDERESLLAEINNASAASVDVKAETVTTVMGDPEAEAMAKQFGITAEQFVFWNQLGVAVLLILGKILGFGLCASMWPRKVETVAAVAVETAPVAASKGETVTIEATKVDTVPALAPAANDEGIAPVDFLSAVNALESPPDRQPAAPKQDTTDLDNVRRCAAVKTFLSTQTEPVARPVDGYTGEEAFIAYSKWADADPRGIPMSMHAFGSFCNDLNVKKHRVHGRYKYLVRSAQEVPALMAA